MSLELSIDEIMDFAIRMEEESYELYIDLAKNMNSENLREIFFQFSLEEQEHKEKLITIKNNRSFAHVTREILDLKIADYIVDVEIEPEMGYQQVLIVAMKKEKAAFKLYTEFASVAKYDDVRETFEFLAMEEAKHKLRFEIEYDDYVLSEM